MRIATKFIQNFNLSALLDTLISSPASGQVLSYNGTKWANTTVALFPAKGSGTEWWPVAGAAPIESYENDEKVFLFEKGAAQSLILWFRVPNAYTPGRQILIKNSFYSPGTSNNFKFQMLTTLVRSNTDAVTSIANQYTSTTGDTSLGTANLYQNIQYDLSNSSGQINSVAIAAGDLIKIKLSRVTPSGTEDTNDVRFISSGSEVLF